MGLEVSLFNGYIITTIIAIAITIDYYYNLNLLLKISFEIIHTLYWNWKIYINKILMFTSLDFNLSLQTCDNLIIIINDIFNVII